MSARIETPRRERDERAAPAAAGGAATVGRLLLPHWRLLALAFVAMLVEGAADLIEPWPLKIVVDHVIGGRTAPAWLTAAPWIGGDRVALLDTVVVAGILIATIGAVGSFAERYLSTAVAQRVAHGVRRALYHHVQRLSLSFYSRARTGDMVVRLTSDIDAVQELVASALLGIVLDVLTLGGMLGVMLWLDWRFTLAALSVAPLLFAVVYRLTRRIKRTAREVKRQESAMASVVQEAVAAARVVKAFGREAYEEARLDRESLESVDVALRARSVKARLASMVDVLVAVGTGLVLLVGARLVAGGTLTTGALLVFVLYLGRMYKPMKDLAKMTDTLSRAAVAFERIGELLRTESQVVDRPAARAAPRLRGEIDLDDVTFGYEPGRPVIHGASLHVEPGQSAALVGPTGGGKSTILALIARFHDVWGGAVRVDGRDVRDYTLESLRDQTAFVLQEGVLFRGTIAENIAYGRTDATPAEIRAAARTANADEFIMAMPAGYDTVIGERGETMSAGQRQRIAIARAMIRAAPILLLDEPSAALDPESEALVFEAVRRLTRGRTSITIAHRLATVRGADVIFVVDDGRVVEQGTHAELMATGGLYARLFRMQFGMETPTSATRPPSLAR